MAYKPMSPRGKPAVIEKPEKSSRVAAPPALIVRPSALTAAKTIDILTLMDSPSLFGDWFKPRESWFPWRVALAAAFGLPIERTGNPKAALRLFVECTGRNRWPTKQAQTFTMICGVRSGKSRNAALIATYLACFREYGKYLAQGERGVIPVIAADRKQARVVFNYASAFVTGSDLLHDLLEAEGELKERLIFATGIDLEVMTASYRATRGFTNVGAVLDEVAFFRSEESASPDVEILQSVRRGTLTIPNSMIVMLSSPYAKRGVLYDTWRTYYGIENSETLVWKAPTWVMNRTVTRAALQIEFDRDADKAAADYGAEFRKDVERFVQLEVIEACVDRNRLELAPVKEIYYKAFVDPSGGSHDSMTLAIGHREGTIIIVDALYEWVPPFSPDSVVSELARYLKNFDLSEATGDKYGGLWPSERLLMHDVQYDAHAKSKSDLYRDMLPLLNSRRVSLPDNKKLLRQIWELERRTTTAGKDSIDHPAGGRDDLVNAVAGLCALLREEIDSSLTW